MITNALDSIPSHKKIYDYALSARNPFKTTKIDNNKMFINSLISEYQGSYPGFAISDLKVSIIALIALEKKASTQSEKAEIGNAIASLEKVDVGPALKVLVRQLEHVNNLEEKSYLTALISHLIFFVDEDQAIETYEKSLEFYPENLYSLNALAHIYSYRKNYDQSISYFSRFISTASKKQDWSNVAKAKSNLGTIYQQSGNYALAIKMYNEAISIHEKIGELAETATQYYNLGQIAEIKKNPEDICVYYRKSRMIFYQHYQDKILDQIDKKLTHYSCY